jgi:hypothetical protein
MIFLANLCLQDFVLDVFRQVVGVSGNVWPDLTITRSNDITHETYFNPNFAVNVAHANNKRLLKAVAKQVIHELKVRLLFEHEDLVRMFGR